MPTVFDNPRPPYGTAGFQSLLLLGRAHPSAVDGHADRQPDHEFRIDVLHHLVPFTFMALQIAG